MFRAFFVPFSFCLMIACSTPAAPPKSIASVDSLGWKIKGFCWSAPIRAIDSTAIKEYQSTNSNSLAIMPYAFCSSSAPTVIFNNKRQYWGERDTGVVATIAMAHAAGLSVMIKPHLWLPKGAFTGALSFETEAQWQQWERSYTDYIVHFARLGDSMQVELFCMGTELKSVVKDRPKYMISLIDTLRKVFRGKLTYAANFDEYREVPFWEKLDMVGVDAYFPISQERDPSVAVLCKEWARHKKELKSLSEKVNRPILLAEYGYRNSDYTTKEPWKEDKAERNDAAQTRALQAIYLTFANEPWIAGGYLWKWFPDQAQMLYASDVDFTPQAKPALDSVKLWYGKK